MPVRVVEDLEMIDIDHEQRKLFSVPGPPLHLLRKPLLKFFMVIKPGQAVGHRHPLRLFQKSRVLDRQRRMDRQGQEGLDIFLSKAVRFVHRRQYTGDPSLANQWNTQQLSNRRLMRRRVAPEGMSLREIEEAGLLLAIRQSEQPPPGEGPLQRFRVDFQSRSRDQLSIPF